MVDVYKPMSPGVTEETRSDVYEVARLHTNNADQRYHPGLRASLAADPA